MATAVVLAAAHGDVEGVTSRTAALRKLLRDPAAVIGAVIVAVVVVCAVFAPLIARADPNAQDLTSTLVPPMWIAGGVHAHPLGTDNLGRDVLTRIVWGARVSAIVGISVVAIGGTIGVTAGLLAGYRRGWVDAVIARITDVQLAFPLVLLAVAIVAVVGPGLWTVIAAIGLTSWVQYVRVVRAETLSLREREFVLAAQAAGATTPRVIGRHLLPERRVCGDRAGHVRDRARDRAGIVAVVPRPGRPADDAVVGRHARRRPPVSRHGVVDRTLPGPRDHDRGDGRELAGRRPARRAGPGVSVTHLAF